MNLLAGEKFRYGKIAFKVLAVWWHNKTRRYEIIDQHNKKHSRTDKEINAHIEGGRITFIR